MVTTTYHKGKIYVPKEIRTQLKLRDGNKMEVEAVGESELQVRVRRYKSAREALLDLLNNPFDLGKIRSTRRREIYEDTG